MENEIRKLIKITTIIKVFDYKSKKIIYGDEFYTSAYEKGYLSPFNKQYYNEINLNELEKHWRRKWNFFGNKWDTERQNYRFLQESFKLFYLSFKQLKIAKTLCINEVSGDKYKMLNFNEISGLHLQGIYQYGKKCVDLLKRLRLVKTISLEEKNFCRRFSETRNKLIEHNYNPKGFNMLIDPSIWSLAGTDSLLEISIHTKNYERLYDVYIDYYEDYYKLEEIIFNIIKKF